MQGEARLRGLADYLFKVHHLTPLKKGSTLASHASVVQ
jgi:hypothetical protein